MHEGHRSDLMKSLLIVEHSELMAWPVPSLRPTKSPMVRGSLGSGRSASGTVFQGSLLSSFIGPRRAGGHLSSKDSPAFCFQASCCWPPALGFFSPGSYRQRESKQVRKRSPERQVGKLVQKLYDRTWSKGVSCQGVNKEAAECHPVLSRLSMAIVTRASRAGGCENCFPRGLGDLSLARKYEAAGWGASAEVWRCWEVRMGQDRPCAMVACMGHDC